MLLTYLTNFTKRGMTMQAMLKKTLDRNLLKYSAGKAICCPSCGQIADYRRWVISETPAGTILGNCVDCFKKGLSKIHDDNPVEYLLSIGWQITTIAKLTDKPKKPKSSPLKTQTQRSRDSLAGHKRLGQISKSDRFFPSHDYPIAQLIGTKTADGIDYNYDTMPISSPEITAAYVREYCRLNHLTGSIA